MLENVLKTIDAEQAESVKRLEGFPENSQREHQARPCQAPERVCRVAALGVGQHRAGCQGDADRRASDCAGEERPQAGPADGVDLRALRRPAAGTAGFVGDASLRADGSSDGAIYARSAADDKGQVWKRTSTPCRRGSAKRPAAVGGCRSM